MKPIIIISAILILLIGGSAALYYFGRDGGVENEQSAQIEGNNDETTDPMEEDVVDQPEVEMDETSDVDSNTDTEGSDMNGAGAYVQFSDGVLEENSDKRRVLFFYANWCPTCRRADPDIAENESSLPADVTVIRVNYDDTDTDQDEKELAQRYDVTYQHTFVQIDEDGTVVTRWNGGEFDELMSNLE